MSVQGDDRGSGFSGINVTPLTDVMLVLLITFLLTASSFESNQQAVPLPQVVEATEVEKIACVVSLEKDGRVLWPESTEQMESDLETLRHLRRQRPERTLALAVHRDCPYEKLYPLARDASLAGWERILLLTEEGQVK